MGMETVGVEQLRAKLVGMDQKAVKKYARDALLPAGEMIAAAAKGIAPVKSGKLRESITLRGGGATQDSVSLIVAPSKKWFKGDQFYAAMQEFGWFLGKRLRSKLYRSKKFGAERYRDDSLKAGRRFVEGKHYMLKAYEATREAASESISENMARAITQDWNTQE